MPEKNSIGATLKAPEVKVYCGDCLFFQRMAAFSEPCEKLGILTKSSPCSRFSVDVFQLTEDQDKLRKHRGNGKAAIAAVEMLGQLSKPDLQRLAALALSESRSRNRGYRAGQQVYVQVVGDSSDPYLNCFMRAWVLQTTRNHVLVRGENPRFRGCYTLESDGVLTERRWKTLKKRLIRAGKLNAPGTPKMTKIKTGSAEDHEPPAIGKSKITKVKDGSVVLRG